MAKRDDNTSERDEIGERADLRSAADLRRLALQEERLAEAADLPRVRDKHRLAARSWASMARALERAERLSALSEVALAS